MKNKDASLMREMGNPSFSKVVATVSFVFHRFSIWHLWKVFSFLSRPTRRERKEENDAESFSIQRTSTFIIWFPSVSHSALFKPADNAAKEKQPSTYRCWERDQIFQQSRKSITRFAEGPQSAQTASKTSVLSATPKVAQILQSTHSHGSAASNMDKLSGNMKWRSKKNLTEFLSIVHLGIGLTFKATNKTNVSLADLTNLTIKRPIHQRTQITRSWIGSSAQF